MTIKTQKLNIDTDQLLNLRWMDPEVFETFEINQATDVYAFGITMYECFTYPYAIPYEEWSGQKVYKKVKNGYRLKPLKNMSREVGELFLECIGDSAERPTFKAIVLCLNRYMRKNII